jgi:hypothetical protein
MEGALRVKLQGADDGVFREGETVVIPAGQAFSLVFESKYVKFHSFTDGDGIESLIHAAGQPFQGAVLPDQAPEYERSEVESAAARLKIAI